MLYRFTLFYFKFPKVNTDIKILETEVNNLMNVNSEYVVKYAMYWFEKEKNYNTIYIITELCGESLRTLLELKGPAFGRQSAEEAMNLSEFFISCHIFKELLECIQCLHDLSPAVIHRDLKPDNILVSLNPQNGRYLKLCDFGLAVLHEGSSVIRHTGCVGTSIYMATEVRLNKDYNTKADVYSLATLIAMTTRIPDNRPDCRQSFYIFDDINGHNILFITNDDMVYGMGSNYYGSLGLGHNRAVNTPHIIPGLCLQNIQQFICGSDICCGFHHSLVLTSDGCVYGWGANMFGQLGCDSHNSSFAVTTDGRVFSWGQNDCHLGHNTNQNQNISRYKRLYKELSELGSGCFGTVYKVKRIITNEIYAIKMVDCPDVNNEMPDMLRTLSNIFTVNLVKYHEFWHESSILYIKMELCFGSLQTVLSLKGPVFGRHSADEAMNSLEFLISCEIFKELLECIQCLHDLSPAVIHRDLKPENVLIAANDSKWFLKLCDYGLTDIFKNLSYKRDAKYLSPEETNGQIVDYKTDVYSAAKIAQNIFDIQMTGDLQKLYSSDKLLYICVTELQKVLISMQSLEPKDRPDCRQLLNFKNESNNIFWVTKTTILVTLESLLGLVCWSELSMRQNSGYDIEVFKKSGEKCRI
ncbi:unnamed protein product [Medioppia subpectinata]|uniref:Protein kinase domain-containing protein n=1 Tax=Medioppia subpectinata TaxID=1979941 RepID=A0A7R9KDH8_9ACAR|nr:unnamed protein product [Medioppia subpectinata]CAG2100101.1 unnamed protein product [Medioppia subpectinata]